MNKTENINENIKKIIERIKKGRNVKFYSSLRNIKDGNDSYFDIDEWIKHYSHYKTIYFSFEHDIYSPNGFYELTRILKFSYDFIKDELEMLNPVSCSKKLYNDILKDFKKSNNIRRMNEELFDDFYETCYIPDSSENDYYFDVADSLIKIE